MHRLIIVSLNNVLTSVKKLIVILTNLIIRKPRTGYKARSTSNSYCFMVSLSKQLVITNFSYNSILEEAHIIRTAMPIDVCVYITKPTN